MNQAHSKNPVPSNLDIEFTIRLRQIRAVHCSRGGKWEALGRDGRAFLGDIWLALTRLCNESLCQVTQPQNLDLLSSSCFNSLACHIPSCFIPSLSHEIVRSKFYACSQYGSSMRCLLGYPSKFKHQRHQAHSTRRLESTNGALSRRPSGQNELVDLAAHGRKGVELHCRRKFFGKASDVVQKQGLEAAKPWCSHYQPESIDV